MSTQLNLAPSNVVAVRNGDLNWEQLINNDNIRLPVAKSLIAAGGLSIVSAVDILTLTASGGVVNTQGLGEALVIPPGAEETNTSVKTLLGSDNIKLDIVWKPGSEKVKIDTRIKAIFFNTNGDYTIDTNSGIGSVDLVLCRGGAADGTGGGGGYAASNREDGSCGGGGECVNSGGSGGNGYFQLILYAASSFV